MQFLSADAIYLNNFINYKSSSVLVFDKHLLVDIVDVENVPDDLLTHHQGLLVPGFVNAHCHLELSHMKDKVSRGTKLVPFLINILQHRSADEKDILKAAEKANKSMYDAGIVAVGDISNKNDTFNLKKSSMLYYHTFIECLGMDPDRVEAYMQPMKKLATEALDLNMSHSLTPHAPYSISENLLESIYNIDTPSKNISLHFQETLAELQLFDENRGDFLEFYSFLNLKPYILGRKNKKETDFIFSNYSDKSPFMLVHNSFSNLETLLELKAVLGDTLYLCTCPKANLYIENTLPDYTMWLKALANNNNICVGTDSLASNDTLDIYAEILTIQSSNKSLSPNVLLQWATINGANALSVEGTFGSFDIGKTPGAVCLPLPQNDVLMPGTPLRIL